MRNTSPALLKYTLLANAAFSGLGGILCITANGFLTEFMGISEGVYLYILGVGLIIFGIDVAFTATRKTINPLFVKMIIGADVVWIIASFLITALMPQLFGFNGIVLIQFIALDVAVFAILQGIGLQRIKKWEKLAV